MQLKDKVAFITGGASGLGRATAENFINAGAKVILFDLNEENAEKTAQELGEHATYAAGDVADETAVSAAIEKGLSAFGAIHVNINSAGIGAAARTLGKDGPMPLKTFEFIVRVNLVGTFNCLRLCADAMTKNEVLTEDGTVRVGAGVIWDDLVAEMLSQRLYGLENLSGIPGTVGAAPVQNIGAYGVELSQFVDSVEVFDLATQTLRRLSATDCDFGYRSSRFRTLTASPYIITAVNLRLSREYRPNLSYPDLAGLPKAIGGSADSLRAEILAIRQRKLPDYRQLGNVGSFFKNPMISAAQKSLLEASGISSGFNRSQDGFKVSAARLIELAVDSRHRVGDARISSRHRLVLENAGRATLADVLALAKAIQASVNAKFGVELEIEPTTLQPLALSR